MLTLDSILKRAWPAAVDGATRLAVDKTIYDAIVGDANYSSARSSTNAIANTTSNAVKEALQYVNE